MSLPSVDMLHIGARRHYAVPRMLHAHSLLRQMFTDVYAGPGSSLNYLRPAFAPFATSRAVKGILQRTSDLPPFKVTAFNWIGIRSGRELRAAKTTWERMQAHHRCQQRLADAVVREMQSPPDVILGFRGMDRLFALLKPNTRCVLDQIDGGIHEVEIVREEQRRHLDWVAGKPDWLVAEEDGTPFWLDVEGERLREEWSLADRIICNSTWTARCLEVEGVPGSKCSVIPLAYDAPIGLAGRESRSRPSELKVGFLGTLTLRKGIHHLLSAAEQASSTIRVKVIAAGGCDVSIEQLTRYSPLLNRLGPIPRNAVDQFFEQIDVLALPSISDGFGIVQLEAMARGIPVIASDRTGDVVDDEISGLKIQSGDVQMLAAGLVRLATEKGLIQHLSRGARQRACDFSTARIAEQWAETICGEVC